MQLAFPANVTGISLSFPDFSTWDTMGALKQFQLRLFEVDTRQANGFKGTRAPPEAVSERLVDIPTMRGILCQTLPVPAGSPGMLVTRVSMHVERNFGHKRWTCVPRVLLHGDQA